MTESTNPAVLGLVKHALEVERKAEVAWIADYQDYLDSDEDTPLPDAGPPGPLFVKSEASANDLRAIRIFLRKACYAESGEAYEIWDARTPVRKATNDAWERLTNKRLDDRIDYKARQAPALPLTPEEHARWHALAHPEPPVPVVVAEDPPPTATAVDYSPGDALPRAPA